jgi:hypothetical protein
MSPTGRALAALLLVLGGTGAGCAAAQAGGEPVAESGSASYDTPLAHRVVDMGRVPESSTRGRLTCDYFPSFLVKELDLGGEGAEWVAMVPAGSGKPPACARKPDAAEKRIRRRDWCGYFAGVKSHYVFLNACAFHNAGLDFAVYDARSGARVFEDTAMASQAGDMEFRQTGKDGLALSYARVALFDCTLPVDQGPCWSRIERGTGLANTAIPVCTPYEKQMTGTVVSYPVEVELGERPRVRAVAGNVRCWPPE